MTSNWKINVFSLLSTKRERHHHPRLGVICSVNLHSLHPLGQTKRLCGHPVSIRVWTTGTSKPCYTQSYQICHQTGWGKWCGKFSRTNWDCSTLWTFTWYLSAVSHLLGVVVMPRRSLWVARAVSSVQSSSTSCSTPWASTTNRPVLTGTSMFASFWRTLYLVGSFYRWNFISAFAKHLLRIWFQQVVYIWGYKTLLDL